MSTLTREVGLRIRSYRLHQGMTQEELAERADLHNTYIGQVERGEKNLTLISLEKILTALDLSFSDFFDHLTSSQLGQSYADLCFNLVNSKPLEEQQLILHILQDIDQISNFNKNS